MRLGLVLQQLLHAAAKTRDPLSQGFVALLEPLLDTVLVCTLTALVIITTGINHPDIFEQGLTGVALTSLAFQTNFVGFDKILSLTVFLFAFSTLVSWSYYGLKSWQFLVGFGKFKVYVFQIVFCIAIVVGCMINLNAVVKFADACLFVLSVPNIIGLYFLLGDVLQLMKK